MRRSFRKWVSEKLLLEDETIKDFIEGIIVANDIETFWKDEILISVLLSDYSEIFFRIFKNELLKDGQKLLRKTTLLLQIACKEVDDHFFKQLGIKVPDMFSVKYIFTKPKGRGWNSLIKFAFENLENIGAKNIDFVLPVIYDWNNKYKSGETTKFSSLIALQYYQWVIDEDVYLSRDNTKNHILQTIIYGSSEIQNELREIFKEIIKNEWKYHRDPYYDLVKTVLTTLDGVDVVRVLPEYVLQLADLFWTYTPKDDFPFYSSSRIGVEQHFGIENLHTDYFPASSYQTPIYWLLQFSLKETIDFILSFTNKAAKSYVESDLDKHEPIEVDVFFDDGKTSKQYISSRLWGSFRGLGVSPNLFASIHMALEKFFLERGKSADATTLESWLYYLLEKTKSASISAVVSSIVLAYSEKTFNIAKILFRTKEFLLYDTSRMAADLRQKSYLLGFKNSLFGAITRYEDEIHEDERLKACDDKHRKSALEHQFLNYQFFRDEETSEEEAKRRQEILWEILDRYYEELPDPSQETEEDKTWRLFLARMDRRKMNPTTEETDNSFIIHWNPEIEPELKEYSEKSLQRSSELMKYSSLALWASYRMKRDEKYKQYEKYELEPMLALREVQEILQKLQTNKAPQLYQFEYSEDESFFLHNHSIPSDVCSVLIRDYFDILSEDDKEFCKNIVLGYASLFLQENYHYQISDGTQSAISVLPLLISENPTEVKIILLLTLFNDYPVDMAHTRFSAFSIVAIQKLWESNFEDAQSLLFGYLVFKPKYEVIRKKLFKENHKRGVYEVREHSVIKAFLEENETDLSKLVENKLSISSLEDVSKIDLDILRTAFQLIPQRTSNEEHKKLAKKISYAFAEKLLSEDRDDDKVDYMVRHDFLEKFAWFVLSSPKEEIVGYLEPFLKRFNRSEVIADLFQEFITAEDYLNEYANFWVVWNSFRGKVIEICKRGDKHWYTEKIVKSYLFAQTHWKETAIEWHTLRDENKKFFRDVLKEVGHCPSALYSISKLLNDIGSSYLKYGISWVSYMIENNENLVSDKLETNTLYYLENLVRKYIYENRENVKRTKKLKQDVLLILDFLTERSSVVGYMLREYIL